jgi:hypothetical protein
MGRTFALPLLLLGLLCLGLYAAHINVFDKLVSINVEKKYDLNDGNLPSEPMALMSDSWRDPSTLIFVGIIHYRDQRCSSTLYNLFSKAKHPDRLRIGK